MHHFLEEHREAIESLCRKHHVLRLALFGSAVREDFRPDSSDVDVLVLFEALPPLALAEHLLGLEADMEALLRRPVDVVREGVLENVYREQAIEREKVLLYAA
jgi:predicted nucleotidyltransferase